MGPKIAQLRVVAGLASTGWAVDLVYVNRGDLWPQWSGCASSTLAVHTTRLQRATPIRSALGTAGASIGIMRTDAQVLYVHNPGDLPAALAASLVRRIPVALHLHLPPPSRQPRWLNNLINRADAVITPSRDTAQRWAQVAGLSDSRAGISDPYRDRH